MSGTRQFWRQRWGPRVLLGYSGEATVFPTLVSSIFPCEIQETDSCLAQLGNVLIVVIICRDKELRSHTTNLYLLSLVTARTSIGECVGQQTSGGGGRGARGRRGGRAGDAGAGRKTTSKQSRKHMQTHQPSTTARPTELRFLKRPRRCCRPKRSKEPFLIERISTPVLVLWTQVL